MAYFIYARKSESDESRQVQSIDDQTRECLTLAKRLGVAVADVLTESRSARYKGRPVFNAMLRRIEAGEAQGIIAWHPDRLSRNSTDTGQVIDLLDGGQITDLKFPSYTFENTPEGKWMLAIVMGQGKYFVDKLAVDVKRGMRSKLEKGHYPHRALVGYLNDRNSRSIVADPERFELVQRALRLVLTGAFSAGEALEILNVKWGFRTRRTELTGGGPLSRPAFYKLMHNSFIMGLMVQDGEVFQGQHPPMLSAHEFEELQQRLQGGQKPLHRQKAEFDFTGLIRCGSCGCAITAESKTKHYRTTGNVRTYVYYHCTNGKGGCSKRGVRQEAIEDKILELLKRLCLPPEFSRWAQQPARAWHDQESGLDQIAQQDLQRSLVAVERRLSNLFNDRFADPDAISLQEFKAQKESMTLELNQLKQAIALAQERREEAERSTQNVFAFAANACEAFCGGDVKVRKEIARSLATHYFLTLEKLEIEVHPLLVPVISIEPLKMGSYNLKKQGTDLLNSNWWSIREQIRTKAFREKLSFRKPSCS